MTIGARSSVATSVGSRRLISIIGQYSRGGSKVVVCKKATEILLAWESMLDDALIRMSKLLLTCAMGMTRLRPGGSPEVCTMSGSAAIAISDVSLQWLAAFRHCSCRFYGNRLTCSAASARKCHRTFWAGLSMRWTMCQIWRFDTSSDPALNTWLSLACARIGLIN